MTGPLAVPSLLSLSVPSSVSDFSATQRPVAVSTVGFGPLNAISQGQYPCEGVLARPRGSILPACCVELDILPATNPCGRQASGPALSSLRSCEAAKEDV